MSAEVVWIVISVAGFALSSSQKRDPGSQSESHGSGICEYMPLALQAVWEVADELWVRERFKVKAPLANQ